MDNKLSVIIPTLNEASSIGKLLDHLHRADRGGHIAEVIIVDGGSTDGTLDKVTSVRGSKFEIIGVSSAKGRAIQLNTGAAKARAGILYFLHADSYPPMNFSAEIMNAINRGKRCGCFRMKFDHSHHLLRFSQWFTRFNFAICRGGDQSLFITAKDFKALKGFNEDYIIYEDGDFFARLYRRNIPFGVLASPVVTSSRRYLENGFWRLQMQFARIHLMYRLGYGPQALYNTYRRTIR